MFTEGQSVNYQGMSGVINFISDSYVTVCIRKYESDSMRGETSVCLCVYPERWQDIIILGDK
jgi:hypothetical protein